MGSFTDELWSSINEIYDAILAHPFLTGLTDGRLPAEASGAVLPCYWIYWEVRKALLVQGSPNPLYRRWIDAHGGEECAAAVSTVPELTEQIGAELGPAERRAMAAHFVTTSRYEWMF